MKSIKFLTYITAAFLFLVAPSVLSAQYCVYNENEKYEADEAVMYKGDDVGFIKWCCEKAFTDGTKPCSMATKEGRIIHTAAKYKRTGVLEYLINDAKVDADLVNSWSQTPTMLAAETGYVPTTKFLVKDKNTNVIAKDGKGCDVLCYAKKSGNAEVIALVKEAIIKQLGLADAEQAAETQKHTESLKQNIVAEGEVKTSKYSYIESQALALNQPTFAEKDLKPQKI